MGRLRQIFSSIGICDSDADLAQKPALIDRIVAYSMPRTSQSSADIGYEQRLRAVLDGARRFQLESLIENDVTVALDRRLSNLKGDFFVGPVYSMYYGKTNTLSLYDNGKMPSENWPFQTRITSHSDDAIGDLVRVYLERDYTPPLMLGTKITTQYASFFAWSDPPEFIDLLKRNPDIIRPPLKDAPASGMPGLRL